MINLDFILLLILILFSIVLLLNADQIKVWFNDRFFSKRANTRLDHICPQCGSTNWKYPNPIKPSSSMINVPELVNNLYECRDCGNIGIFYVVDEAKHFKPKIEVPPLKDMKNGIDHYSILSWAFVVLGFLSIFLGPSLYWGVIFSVICFSIARKLSVNNKK